MSQVFLSETHESLAHASAIIGASAEERAQFLDNLQVSAFDTITIDAEAEGGIGEVRKFANQLLMSPQFGDIRLGVVYSADKLTIQAQNALLKLLEEPPASVKLVLFLAQEGDVLPTVFSRCRLYYGQQARDDEFVGQYLDDPIAQLLDAENLAKDEHVGQKVRGWLVTEYEAWCLAGRPVEGLDRVARFWHCYQGIESGVNKRLLLEQLVISSL